MARPRFIIVEGVECAEKAALVRALADLLRPHGWALQPPAYHPGRPFERYLSEYTDAQRAILTRSHYAEMVTDGLRGKEAPFSRRELEFLDTFVGVGGLVVFCDPPAEKLAVRLLAHDPTEQPDAVMTLTELTASASGFARLLRERPMDEIGLDSHKCNYNSSDCFSFRPRRWSMSVTITTVIKTGITAWLRLERAPCTHELSWSQNVCQVSTKN